MSLAKITFFFCLLELAAILYFHIWQHTFTKVIQNSHLDLKMIVLQFGGGHLGSHLEFLKFLKGGGLAPGWIIYLDHSKIERICVW